MIDECAATGRTCEYGAHGRNGESQCTYCGGKPDRKLDEAIALLDHPGIAALRCEDEEQAWCLVKSVLARLRGRA